MIFSQPHCPLKYGHLFFWAMKNCLRFLWSHDVHGLFTNCHTMDLGGFEAISIYIHLYPSISICIHLYPSVSIYILCSCLEDLKNLQSRPPVDHEQRGITTGDDPVESSCSLLKLAGFQRDSQTG